MNDPLYIGDKPCKTYGFVVFTSIETLKSPDGVITLKVVPNPDYPYEWSRKIHECTYENVTRDDDREWGGIFEERRGWLKHPDTLVSPFVTTASLKEDGTPDYDAPFEVSFTPLRESQRVKPCFKKDHPSRTRAIQQYVLYANPDGFSYRYLEVDLEQTCLLYREYANVSKKDIAKVIQDSIYTP